MELELLKEKNAQVARHLPGSVWYICVVVVPHKDRSKAPGTGGFPPVQDMEIHGTFTTPNAANDAAARVLDELKAEAGTRAIMHSSRDQGLVSGMVPSQSFQRVVQINRDNGPLDENRNPL